MANSLSMDASNVAHPSHIMRVGQQQWPPLAFVSSGDGSCPACITQDPHNTQGTVQSGQVLDLLRLYARRHGATQTVGPAAHA
jgi:hypothetical protein